MLPKIELHMEKRKLENQGGENKIRKPNRAHNTKGFAMMCWSISKTSSQRYPGTMNNYNATVQGSLIYSSSQINQDAAQQQTFTNTSTQPDDIRVTCRTGRRHTLTTTDQDTDTRRTKEAPLVNPATTAP